MVNQLNIMLFSDHGMAKIHWMEKVIELDKYINMADIVKMMDRGPVVSLWPEENKFQEVKPESLVLSCAIVIVITTILCHETCDCQEATP